MGTGAPLKTPSKPQSPDFIMTRDLALSLLRSGNDGAELLQILETIATDDGSDAEPTLEEIQF